jgi:D-beta-D-heptose 7-phosphate kinase / D-beta-D-heptose 1-phosphate adenosyltransferase
MHAHLIPSLEKLVSATVLVAGDVMLDRFVYGHVERISPEAPIPVLRIAREMATLGGAGNVARNLVALGADVDLVAVIGQDTAGYELSKQFSDCKEISPYLLTDNSRPTTVKTRFVADGQQLLRADHEISIAVSRDIEDQVLLRLKNAMQSAAIIILSDYAKGVLTDRIMAEVIAAAKEQNKPIIIDPKGKNYDRYNGAFMITPNRRELAEATRYPAIKTVQDADMAARQLIESYNLHYVLAKLGSDGIALVGRDMPTWHFKANAREVFDVSGAGDTVVATMALALASGVSIEDSAALANIAGSIVVGKIGTATVSKDELRRELHHDQSRENEEKILSPSAASEKAERWRKQGLIVGFTNGVFDLLHPGHISLLRQARANCDKLIVGMNSDASVKRLKGEGRPVQNVHARAHVLASLADVDAVVTFAEDTPLQLIHHTRPSVLVKGADYKLEDVVGGDLVQQWGGKIVLAKLAAGHSTSQTIERLQKANAEKKPTS